MLETGPLLEVGLLATKFSLPGAGFWILRGRAAAMGTGVGRGSMDGCIATVAISVLGTKGGGGDKGGYGNRMGLGLGAASRAGLYWQRRRTVG